jgi:hypothetical protein
MVMWSIITLVKPATNMIVRVGERYNSKGASWGVDTPALPEP